MYNKNRPEEVEALKEKIGVTLTEEVGDKFALTGSIGVVKADSNVRAAIANELRRIGKLGDGEARIRLAHIMGGANTALAIAKKEVEKRKAHQKAKGDRVHVLSSSGDLRIDEWFQGADGIASIFHEDIQQEEIQTAFDESEIPDNERDVQVPTVYSDAALREKVYSNPSGIIFALDALWGHERFDEFAAFTEETLKKPHKGCSELKGWYKFGMLNDALPKMMHDADWVIRLFGYVVNARVRELFNSDAYEVYIARAPPGQSPDRFLVWITSKDEARHKLSIDSLKNDLPILLEDVAEEIASYSIRASLQATVVPIQEKPPMTFGLIDRLSKLPVDYDEGLEDGEDKKMYQPVLKPFKEAMLNTGENVIITEDEHRIVVYDEENAHIEDMEAALSRFIALRRQYALKALDGAMPEETEYYHGTLREIYADIVGLDKNLPFFEAVIPDEMSFVVAEKLIIEQIKNRRAKRLAEIQERLEINWRSVFGHALLDEMRHMLSKISGIIYTLEEFIDIPDIELHRELIDAPIEISDEEKSKAETRRDLRGLPDSDIQAPQLIPTQEVIAMFERALLAIRAINEHLALLDLEDEKVRLIIGREGQDAEIKHIRGLFTLLNSLLDRGEFKLAADILEAQVEFLQEEQHTRAVSIEDAWNGFVKRMDYKTERPLAGEKEEIRRFWNSADRRLSFKVNSLNPYISVHPVLLQRIFGEMVSNAAMKNKGQEDLEILISVNDGFNDEGKPQLIITVEDNGKGIPREMREIDNGSGRQRLFTLEGTTTGGGVGLTEAYLIVSDANGTITADNKSSVGKEGARFTIRLPRSISGEMNQLAKQVAIRLREHYIQDSQLLIRELLRDGEIQYREGTLTLAEYVKEVAEKSKMEIEELLNSFQPDDWEELAVLIWENVTLEPYEIRARLENSLKIQGEILSEIAEVEDRDIQDNFPGTILGDDLPKKHELFKRMKAIDTSRRIREPAGKDAVMFDISAPGFETLLNRYIELPAQAIIRRILELGGTPYLSNAFGPGIIGVRWSKDGIRYFTPLTVDEYDFERLADETFGKRQSALLRSSKWEELDADLWDQVLEEDKQLIEKLISADSDEQERLMQKYPDRIYPPANDLEGEGRSFYVELLEPINDVNNGSIATISVLQLKGIKPEADNKGEVLVRNVGVGKNISVDRRSFSLNIERIDEPSGGATKSASDYEHKIYKELAQEGLVASPIGRGIYHQLSFGKEQEMLGHIALGLEDVDTRLSLVVDEDIESAYLGIFNKKTGETTFVGSREDEAKLMEQIGRRLRMEHDLGYAHRAIFSFDNIRIHVANGEWVVRLIDREATLRLGDQPEIEEVAYRLLDISKVLARLWLEDTGPLSNQLNEALLRGYFNTETPPTPSDFDGPRALWGRLYMFIGGRAIEENDWNEGPLSLLLNGLETITVNNRVNRQRAQLMNLVATEVPELGGLMNETDTVRKAETETKATGQTIAISFNTLTLSYEDDSKYYMFDIREAIELALGAGNKVLLFSETSTDEEIRKNLLDAGVPEILLSSLEIVAGEEAVGEIDRSNLSALISNRDDYPDIQDKLGASEQTEYGMLENHNIALLEIPSMLSGIVYLMVQNGTLKVENANGFISKLVGSVADGQIPNYYTATLDAADKIRENL